MRVIELTPSRAAMSAGLSPDEFRAIVLSAATRWNEAAHGRCGVQLRVTGAQDRWLATQDSVNLIVMRQKQWCHNDYCSPKTTFAAGTLAMTSNYPAGSFGAAVLEADVEINAQRVSAVAHANNFGALTRTQSGYWMLSIPGHSQSVPLEVILVHELGHVLGLKDACVTGVRVTGQPRFGACTAAQRASVMFPDSKALKPTDEDVASLAEIYPLSASEYLRLLVDRTIVSTKVVCSAAITLLIAFAVLWLRRKRTKLQRI